MVLDQLMHFQCTLRLVLDVYCFHRGGSHFEDYVCSLRRVKNSAPLVIAVLVELAVNGLLILRPVYYFVHH